MRTFEIRTVDVEGEMKERPVDVATSRVYGSKSQVAGYIFDEVVGDDSIETKHQRGAYINRCKAELNMTSHGASTYFYNKRKKAAGGDEYQHNKNSAAKKKAAQEAPVVEEAQTEVELHRWRVVLKDTRAIVNSFTGRKAAQLFNKEQKEAGLQTVMIDGEKQAA